MKEIEITAQQYKEALNAAMLYAQSGVEDACNGCTEPSEHTNQLLEELTTKHGAAVKQAARELNNFKG